MTKKKLFRSRYLKLQDLVALPVARPWPSGYKCFEPKKDFVKKYNRETGVGIGRPGLGLSDDASAIFYRSDISISSDLLAITIS